MLQQATDGWLGPAQVSGGDYWGRSNIMFAMLQYAEAEPDLYSNITGALSPCEACTEQLCCRGDAQVHALFKGEALEDSFGILGC